MLAYSPLAWLLQTRNKRALDSPLPRSRPDELFRGRPIHRICSLSLQILLHYHRLHFPGRAQVDRSASADLAAVLYASQTSRRLAHALQDSASRSRTRLSSAATRGQQLSPLSPRTRATHHNRREGSETHKVLRSIAKLGVTGRGNRDKRGRNRPETTYVKSKIRTTLCRLTLLFEIHSLTGRANI